MKRGQGGFWLGEIVVAIGLIAVVTLTVVGVFSFLAITSQTRSEHAAAELLADTLMETAVTTGPPGWGVGEANVLAEVPIPVSLETGDSQGAESMTSQVIPEPIEVSNLGTLFRVRVRIAWHEPPGPGNVERGKGFIERVRTIYIEDFVPD